MLIRHKSFERVKNYLLGTLDEKEADRLEGRYFTDPKFFRKVQDIETKLILDFLDEKLLPAEADKFRSKYLVVPELRKRYNEVQKGKDEVEQSKDTRVPALAVRWRFALAGLALIACAFLPWLFLRHSRAPEETARLIPPSEPVVAEITLVPGTQKSGRSQQVEFPVRNAVRLRFLLELPGRTGPPECAVTIVVAGEKQPSWSSPPLTPEVVGENRRLKLELNSSILPPNDYFARVTDPGSNLLETYPFRIVSGN